MKAACAQCTRNPCNSNIASDRHHGAIIELGPLEPNRIFGQRLAAVGLEDVFYTPSRDPDERIIDLPNLHRMMLHTLQRDLIEEVGKIRCSGTVSSEQATRIRTALSTYGAKPFLPLTHSLANTRIHTASALRDWALIIEYSVKADVYGSQDPFVLTSNRPLDHCLMSEAGLIHPNRAANPSLEDAFFPPTNGGTRLGDKKREKSKAFLERLYMAIFGGVVLVGPMLLMVLYKHPLTSPLTVSIAVFVFALVMAAFSTESPGTVLTAVAAYAAVLVVFVGTSS